MEPAQRSLAEAAQAGNINALYETLGRVPKILDEIDGIPFVNTPLHEAASAGQTHFAIEIMSLKPSFGKKLNPDGLSPLHLALKNRCFETVKRLIKYDCELIRVKGREQQTPLHYVAEIGDIDILAEFLCACPASIKELTIREETAIHIAIKRYNLEAFRVIFMWFCKTYNGEVLNWKDEDGNTALHIAVATNQPEIVRLIVKKAPYSRNQKNLVGFTALDIASRLGPDAVGMRKILGRSKVNSPPEEGNLADFLLSPDYYVERVLRYVLYCRKQLPIEMQNVVLVVAALIATATFQAILSPPGGLSRKDDGNQSPSPTAAPSPIAETEYSTFNIYVNWFYYFNTTAFTCSIATINLVLSFTPLTSVLNMSLVFLAVTYGLSMHSVSPPDSGSVNMMIWQLVVLCIAYFSKAYFWDVEMKIKAEKHGLLELDGVYRSRFHWPLAGSIERLRMVYRVMG